MLLETTHSWIAILTIVLVILMLFWDRVKASLVFTFAVFVFISTGIIGVQDYFDNFSNQSVITIFLLIFLTSVVKRNYNIIGLLDKFFGNSKSEKTFLFKLGFSVAGLSSLMNNTPIVALLTPYVYQWGKKHDVAPSKLLMPLSFAAILGGVITVIGTSTNLVLNGFLRSNNEEVLSTLDFIVPGIIVTVFGVVYFVITYNILLPSNTDILSYAKLNLREYLFETRYNSNSKEGDLTVSEVGFRNLKGAYLVQIHREDEIIQPVGPNVKLRTNDRLYFAGDSNTMVELVEENERLTWAKSEKFMLGNNVKLIEVVIPRNSSLIGLSLKEAAFRERYDSAVVAIHRNGEKLNEKLGRIKLEVGDLLLLTAGEEFEKRIEQNKDLYSVSVLKSRKETEPWKKVLLFVVAILGGGLLTFNLISFVFFLLVLLIFTVSLKMTSVEELKKQVNLDLLLILVGALTLGKGLIDSGAAEIIGKNFIDLFISLGQEVVLIALFSLTLILTTFVTNVAALSIVFPLAFQIVKEFDVNGTPFYLAIAFAASAAFITPVSYQTNLIVYGPGGYKFKDFAKFGTPLTLIYSLLILSYLIFFVL